MFFSLSNRDNNSNLFDLFSKFYFIALRKENGMSVYGLTDHKLGLVTNKTIFQITVKICIIVQKWIFSIEIQVTVYMKFPIETICEFEMKRNRNRVYQKSPTI